MVNALFTHGVNKVQSVAVVLTSAFKHGDDFETKRHGHVGEEAGQDLGSEA